MDHIVVFRLQLGAAVGEQELHERVQELDVAFGRLQREWIHPRAVFADPVNLAAVQLHDTLVAAADVEDVGESAVLLLERDELVAMHGLAASRLAR